MKNKHTRRRFAMLLAVVMTFASAAANTPAAQPVPLSGAELAKLHDQSHDAELLETPSGEDEALEAIGAVFLVLLLLGVLANAASSEES